MRTDNHPKMEPTSASPILVTAKRLWLQTAPEKLDDEAMNPCAGLRNCGVCPDCREIKDRVTKKLLQKNPGISERNPFIEFKGRWL